MRARVDELEPAISARHAHAAVMWPGVVVAIEPFARAVIERLDEHDPEGSLQAMQTDDLYLACACAAGDPAGLAAFESHCGPAIGRAIAARRASTDERAELGQVIRQRLLVASTPGRSARIAGYAARGSLQAWVRVVVAREAARMLPRARREIAAENEQLAQLLVSDDNPEIAYLKQRYRHEFKLAFQAAIDHLDDRDRLVLQQYALDRLTIDQLAALHSIHRATAARWIQIARDKVLAHTERALRQALHLTRSEFANILQLIRSQLEVSLERVLRD